MTTAVIVQARMNSTRLPGKVMLPLAGEPMIRHVLRRCKLIPNIDAVLVAPPDDEASKPIIVEAMKCGAWICKGSETDVLARYHKAAVSVSADIIVRITADCPLLDPVLCGDVLEAVAAGWCDYASNVHPRGFPKGLDCEAFTMHALMQAHKKATDPYDREHVTSWMHRNLETINIEGPGDMTEDRWTLDTPEDYEFLKGMFDKLYDWKRMI